MADKKIKTTHVGSLIRPDGFADLLQPRIDGELADGEFLPRLKSAVDEIVAEQVACGVDVVSDGEMGKLGGWEQYVLSRLTGFGPRAETDQAASGQFGDAAQFPEFYAEYWPGQRAQEAVYPCVGDITYVGHDELQRDITNLRAAMEAAGASEGFLPVAAPASAFALSPNEHYASDTEYMQAGAAALREEYKAITDAGLYVQIDDAHLPFQYDVMVPPATMTEYRAWARTRIEALNTALEGIPTDRVRYHICWGSWNGPHVGDVPLAEIIDLLLEVNTGAYCVEAANPRHEHEWKVWRDVDLGGRTLIPGVISHQTNVVEHPELVAERLLRFASVAGAENVMGGSDCGFAQGPFVRRMHPTVQWAKLRSLAEGARLASTELFGS